jgi:hypothetical protein
MLDSYESTALSWAVENEERITKQLRSSGHSLPVLALTQALSLKYRVCASMALRFDITHPKRFISLSIQDWTLNSTEHGTQAVLVVAMMLGSLLDAVERHLGLRLELGVRYIFGAHNAYHQHPGVLSVPSPPSAKSRLL